MPFKGRVLGLGFTSLGRLSGLEGACTYQPRSASSALVVRRPCLRSLGLRAEGKERCNVGVLIIRIRLWFGVYCYEYDKEPCGILFLNIQASKGSGLRL